MADALVRRSSFEAAVALPAQRVRPHPRAIVLDDLPAAPAGELSVPDLIAQVTPNAGEPLVTQTRFVIGSWLERELRKSATGVGSAPQDA